MIRNHKWPDYGLQKVKVTDTRHYTESERFNINLQVANYWLLEMKSLNYEEVFFVEFYVNFSKFNTPNLAPSLSASPQWNSQKILNFLLGFLDPPVLCAA